MPQPQPRQQSRLNDIQMLQRQIMIKKLQELQRQQQFQELGDIRQQNYINQQSILNKQGSGDQFPPLINGTPIHDGSQRYMAGNVNFLHQGSSPVQGFPNGIGFPQDQSHAHRSVGLVSPQYDASLYWTPVNSVGNNLGQYSQLLGAPHDSVNVFAKGNSNQEEKSLMQSSAFSNSLRSNQFDASSNKICMQGAFVSEQEFKEKNLFGQVPTQSSSSEVLGGNFQQANSLQRYTSEMEVGGSEEQAGWPGVVSEKVTHDGPSQSSCALDPLEQKILFNMDDDSWDASFGRSSNISSGILQDAIENTEHMSSFPSVQSGSWSALMQSAVAEASSSDTRQQEEWSSVSFQTERLTDNQHSNFMDRGRQNSNWTDNNLMSMSSLSSKAQQFNNSNMNSNFPGFQHPGIQFSLKQKEGMCIDSSHDSNHHQSPKNNSKWFDSNSQQKQTTEASHAVQSLSHLQSAWPGHNYEHSETDACRQSISSYTNLTQAGNITWDACKASNSLWKTEDNCGAGSFSNSVGSEHRKTIEDERAANIGHSQHHQIKSPQISLNAFNGESGTYEKQECIQKENSSDSYHSNASQHNISGNNLREHMWLHKSDSRKVEDNQGPSNQVLCQQISQGPGSYELGYAEQLKFYSNVSSIGLDLEKGHLPDIQKTLAEEVSPRFNGSGWQDSSSSKYIASNSHGANLTVQTSQNMLELLHKVENSSDYQLGMHFGSNDSTPISEAPHTENHDAFAAQLCNKPSPSQSFGLRLSPPSQRFPNSNCFDSSQGSPQMGNSRGAVSSGPSLLRNQLQNQHQLNAPVACRSQEAALPGSASSQDTSHRIFTHSYSQALPILEANPVSRPFLVSGESQQTGFSTMWTNAPTQRNQTGTESHKAPFSFLPSPDSTNSSLENTSTATQEINNEIYFRGQNETGTCSLKSEGSRFLGEQARKETSIHNISSGTVNPVSQKVKLAYGKESVPHILADTTAYASGSLVTKGRHQGFDSTGRGDNQSRKISDLEVFGRSLKPAHVSSQNYSLLQQVHSMKHVDNDQSKGVLAKISGVDELNPTLHTDLTSVGRRHHFSSEMKGNQSGQNLAQPLLQDTNQNSTFVHDDSQGISDATPKSQISPQMAPSWFKHYGTLKNGQMLPMFDTRVGHQFNPYKVFEHLSMNSSVLQINSTDTAQASGVWPTTGNNLVAVNQPHALPHDITAQNSDVLRIKKRKYVVFESLPWHKELAKGPERILDISLSDRQWAQAANRLIEKVADEAATTEDALNVRPKKRIALTTKLMQHIFRPAPAVVLSGQATSKCDSVVHYAARLTLGDACCLSSSFHKPIDSCNMSAEKPKTPERTGDKESTKLVEDFISRSKKLEANFLSLDKSASISELKVEAQELEKFSLITRLAKFHSRGQAGLAEASTSSGTTRPYMHRYVTAAPMPRTLPEGAQCFQL